MAGCVISPVTQTQYDRGAPLAIKGFTVAILGGLGNSMAAVTAGLMLGLIEVFMMSQLTRRIKAGLDVEAKITLVEPKSLRQLDANARVVDKRQG